MEEDVRAALLDRYYKDIHATMLAFQSPSLGLFPRGESQHARVRDNIYCAAALWCFSLAYRQVGDDKGRTHEMEQSAVKCMRGILFCYMRQANKVEQFKYLQSWENALHSRFDYMTGDHVTDDKGWGHLQIDSTSLYLLTLAQMTASGAQVIFTMDEVDFIQNLVYYVERAYRIPDYGMWERGSRDNVGRRELHASSIGMAKAALEAMNGLNLFGEQGSLVSTIHVDPDAQYRNCVILNNLLPKESSSKETDASLLCITGYPAFAIDDPALRKKTEARVKELLEGNHGFRRFLRDGHHTVRENQKRKYYDPTELRQFEGIECEWPLFYLLLVLTEMFRGNHEEAEKYWKKFEDVEIDHDGHVIASRLFYVPESELTDEVATTVGSLLTLKDLSYRMEPLIEKVPFMMAQAIYFMTKLARDNLFTINDMDPLGLHLPHSSRHSGMARHLGFKAPGHETIIQMALIAETTRLQAILATHGIPTQTQRQVEPIKIRAPQDTLMKVLHHIGENKKLGLSGRPNRPIGALGTSKVYRIFGQTVVFYPTDSMADFYTSFDVMVLIDTLKSTLQFLNQYWNMTGRPTLCLYLTEHQLKGSNFRQFVNFLAQVKQGEVDGVKVRLHRLQSLISSSYIEHLECTRDEDLDIHLHHSLINPLRSRSSALRLSTSTDTSNTSLFSAEEDLFTVDDIEIQQLEDAESSEEIQPSFGPADIKNSTVQQLRVGLKREENPLGELYFLHELTKRNETQYNMHTSIQERVQDIYEEAGEKRHWTTVRLAAALLRKVVDCLAPSMTNMLVRGKEVTIGIFGYPEHVVSEPLTPKEIVQIVYEKCMPYDPIEAVLHQEIIIFLADYISSSFHSAVFDGMLRLRIGWIIQAMKNDLGRLDRNKSLQQLPPHEVKELLIRVLKDDDTRSQLDKRQLNGALNRVPPEFYQKIFGILERIQGGIYVRGKKLPQLPTIHEVASHEMNFALKVEEFLSSITFPEYRQLIVELLMVVSTILERNPEVNFPQTLNLDELLQDSIAMFKADKERQIKESKDQPDSNQEHHSTSYACHRGNSFYALFPDGQFGTTSYMAKAVVNRMLQEGLHYDPSSACVLS